MSYISFHSRDWKQSNWDIVHLNSVNMCLLLGLLSGDWKSRGADVELSFGFYVVDMSEAQLINRSKLCIYLGVHCISLERWFNPALVFAVQYIFRKREKKKLNLNSIKETLRYTEKLRWIRVMQTKLYKCMNVDKVSVARSTVVCVFVGVFLSIQA